LTNPKFRSGINHTSTQISCFDERYSVWAMFAWIHHTNRNTPVIGEQLGNVLD
jgi:hypothetical protein